MNEKQLYDANLIHAYFHIKCIALTLTEQDTGLVTPEEFERDTQMTYPVAKKLFQQVASEYIQSANAQGFVIAMPQEKRAHFVTAEGIHKAIKMMLFLRPESSDAIELRAALKAHSDKYPDMYTREMMKSIGVELPVSVENLNAVLGDAIRHRDAMSAMNRNTPNQNTLEWRDEANESVKRLQNEVRRAKTYN